ncbi:amidase domain-containing protein [Nocardia sp. NPDC058666]|uniref:amidase domain-containing protein n=1 Tax=unclassified Nocardia TaxID=2637762 RepID=UPI0036565354
MSPTVIPTRDQVLSWDISTLKSFSENAGKIGNSILQSSNYVFKIIHDDLQWSGAARNSADDRAEHEQRDMREVASAYYNLEDATLKLYQAIEYSVEQIKQVVKLREVEPVVIGNDQGWTVYNMEDESEAQQLSGSLVGFATTIADSDELWKVKIREAIDDIFRMAPISNGSVVGPQSLSPERQAAVDYANEWAMGRNPDYPDFGDSDCTNFVSQALRAGGFDDEGDGGAPRMHRADDGRWYYDDDTLVSDQSHTWSGAPNMYEYLTRDDPKSGTPNGNDVQTGTIPSTTAAVDPLALSNAGLKPGDIVQYELSDGANSSAGTINHTAIYVGQKPVTLPNGQTVMADVVDYHSKDSKQVPWSLQQGGESSFPVKYHMIKVNYPGEQ